MKHLDNIIYAIFTILSIANLVHPDAFPGWARILIGAFGLLGFIYILFSGYKKNVINERVCTSEAEISAAMKDIIKSQGKIAIVSRDLTWVNAGIIRELIKKKDSILIFAEAPNDKTAALKEKGIRVKFYGKYGFTPQTRFTVIRHNRPQNAQVAIANVEGSIRRTNRFKHTIYETLPNGSPQDAWINSLAVDMIHFCDLVCEEDPNG